MNEYIKVIREKAGHVPLLVCGTDVIAFNDDNQVLMIQRTDNGLWAFPGGTVDIGETVEDTAARELLEETGLTAHELEFFTIASGGEEMMHTYPNGDVICIVSLVYITYNATGTLTPDESEVAKLQYYSVDKLPSRESISPPARQIVSALQRSMP